MKTAPIAHKQLAIEILVEARRLINSETRRYLCHAITLAVIRRRALETDYTKRVDIYVTETQLKNWIKNLLEGIYDALETWIMRTTPIDLNKFKNSVFEKRMMEARLNWADWMISELEKVK